MLPVHAGHLGAGAGQEHNLFDRIVLARQCGKAFQRAMFGPKRLLVLLADFGHLLLGMLHPAVPRGGVMGVRAARNSPGEA